MKKMKEYLKKYLRSVLIYPSFVNVRSSVSFQWGETDAVVVADTVTSAYDEITQWKKNLFQIPPGSVGKSFIRELSSLFQSYNEGAGMESVTLHAAMIMPALLLQRTGPRMKRSEMKCCLERRIGMWKKAKIDDRLNEGKVLQFCLADHRQTHDDDVA